MLKERHSSAEGRRFLCAHLKPQFTVQDDFVNITTSLEANHGPVRHCHRATLNMDCGL